MFKLDRNLQVRNLSRDRFGSAGDLLMQYRGSLAGGHRQRTGNYLISDHAQRIDIAGRGYLNTLHLFRTHICRRAKQHSCGSQILGVSPFQHFGDTKIKDRDKVLLATPIRYHDIVRLEIAVNNTLFMRLDKRITNLDQKPDCPLPGQPPGRIPLGSGQLTQSLALNKIHHHEQESLFRLIQIEGIDGMRICEPGNNTGFVEKTGDHILVITELCTQHFDGY